MQTALADRPQAAAPEKTHGAGVPLNGKVDIYPEMPRPEFDGVGGQAYAARMRDEAASDLIAIVCNGKLPPRLDYLAGMRSAEHPSVMRLVDSGVVAWPDGRYLYTFAYQHPPAPRFMRFLEETHAPMSEDAINHHFVAPLIGALAEFTRTGVFHGAIRPTNLFWRFGSTTPPQLGECLSVPSGIGQPVLFETVERGMAAPLARGPGSHADDCYAFGVMVALFILGQNPLKGLDDNAILQLKMERGSFNALIGNHRLSPTQIELLRGLLTDDGRQRWASADLEQWKSGRRLTPRGTDIGRRASRHFEFMGREYWQVRPLANAFAGHVPEAVRAVENGSLDKWLRRSLGDEERAASVGEAVASLKLSGKTANFDEQLVARTCIALDPSAPIRYRGLAVMPAGIPVLLAEAVMNGGNISLLADTISSQLVTFWVDRQKELKVDLVPLAQQFERLMSAIEKSSYGNGIERALYELNPALPCLSPMLRAYYATTPKALLPALEKVAASAERPQDPVDRHIAAFLAVRDRRSDIMLEYLSPSENPIRRGLAMLTIFSEMQYRYGPDHLPQLARWLLGFLEPSVRRYFGVGLRNNIQKHIQDAADKGNIKAMAHLIDNPERIERDREEFTAARLLYFSILKEIAHLEKQMKSRTNIAEDVGKPLAATLSCLLALLLAIASAARAVWMGF
ncbi:MAG TPA: serine/threonine protein kinase [Alphaproteobacteria bacterium]|nr:serine/threonine protein kinase [Alphaproteobacteria bacterium]